MEDGAKAASKKELRRIAQSELLSRLVSVERRLVAVKGAWICRLRYPEAKYAGCHNLFQWAEHVEALRHRLKELPGGKPELKPSAAAEEWLQELLFAEDEAPFLHALFHAVLPRLRDGYADYLDRTGELTDRPTVRQVRDIVRELDAQISGGLAYLAERHPQEDGSWTRHIGGILESAGGLWPELSAEEIKALRRHPGETYRFPEVQHRQPGSYYSYDHPIEGYQWSQTLQGDPNLERVSLGVWLYNEMDACEYISTILYEVDGMPWDFYYDVARHTWDEARHSEFGFRLLKELGFSHEEFEVWVATFMSSMKLSPLERYTAVTCWYEPGSFLVKPDYLERVARDVGGDDLVVELLKFDLADETLHVSFGHKWVPKLMEHYGETRPLKEFVDAVKAKGERIRREQGAAFVSTMPAERRHSMETIRARLNEWAERRGDRLIRARG